MGLFSAVARIEIAEMTAASAVAEAAPIVRETPEKTNESSVPKLAAESNTSKAPSDPEPKAEINSAPKRAPVTDKDISMRGFWRAGYSSLDVKALESQRWIGGARLLSFSLEKISRVVNVGGGICRKVWTWNV